MKKLIFLVSLATSLSACADAPPVPPSADPEPSYESGDVHDGPLAHTMRKMDKSDREKITHALDSPIGKETGWTNSKTGIQYTLVSTEKLTVHGNPLCRRYRVSAEKGNWSNETTNVACVDKSSGRWKPVS